MFGSGPGGSTPSSGIEISAVGGDTVCGMNGAAPQTEGRGTSLLLSHLEAFEALEQERPSAQERLSDALGPELSKLLVTALAAGRRARLAA